MPVYKYNGEINKIQPKKLESITEEIQKKHPLLKNKLAHKDNDASSRSVKSIDEIIVQESQVINVDSITPPYEVIDGTTFYSDSEPSIQPNFVSEVAHATASLNEQDSIDSKINPDHEEPLFDKNTFINNKESQADANDASKVEGIKLPLDIHEQTNTEILLESSKALINSTLDEVSKDDTPKLDENSKFEDESSKKLEHKEKLDNNKVETDNSAEENIEDNKKEEIIENVESEGIFASLTNTFKILSSSQDIAATESTTIQNDDDILVSKIENDLQLKQISEDVEVKDTVAEKHVPTIQIESDLTIDLINKEKIEIQQEIIHENIESAKVLDETKIEEETSNISLENATSPSDVPLSNNFVYEDAVPKPAKELPTIPSTVADDSSISAKTDSLVENIEIQETNKEEKVTENVKDIVESLEKESIISDLKETVNTKSVSIQSSSDIEQKLPENDKMHSENTKEDISHKETFVQVTTNNNISETINLSPVMKTAIEENITKESFLKNIVGENIVGEIIDEALNHSATDISFTEKFIVHSNINKNGNSVNDANSDNVLIEPNEFSNGASSGIVSPETSLDSPQKEILNQVNFNEVLQNQDLLNIEEDLEHKKDQMDSSVKEEETLPEYGDYINSEDKVLYKDEYIKEDLKKPESKLIIPNEIQGIQILFY